MKEKTEMSDRPATRRTTIADVANLAQVSVSTVDRVLNGRAPVRSDTAGRIREAADALGFHAAGVVRERMKGTRVRRTLGFLLQAPHTEFYRNLAQGLSQASVDAPGIRGQAVVAYVDDISPDAVSRQLASLGRKADAVAVVAADHPLVSAEIARLKERGVPVFALLSDLGAAARAGYAGLDNRRVGRTAAWFVTQLARQPGKLAIFVGSHRFQSQELCEMSFRSYVREHAPAFELLEPLVTLESDTMAEEGVRDLLQRHPDLAGFYVAGGGIDGVLRALRELQPRRDGHAPIGVGHEFTRSTHEGLVRGELHAVLSNPIPLLAARLVAQMVEALANPTSGFAQVIVPMDTQTPESS